MTADTMVSMSDPVSQMREAWQRERPDLDPSAMATVGCLLRLSALIGEQIDWFAAERGISRPEGDVLMTLRRIGAPHRLSRGELGRSLVLTAAGLTSRLDQLERQGLIREVADDSDPSAVQVELTDKGKAMVDEFLPAHVETEERLLEPLTAADRDALDAMVAKLMAPLQPRGQTY